MSGYFKHNTNRKNTSEVRVYRAGHYKRSPIRTSALIAVAMFLALCFDVTALSLYPGHNPNGTLLLRTWPNHEDDQRPNGAHLAESAASSPSTAAEINSDPQFATGKPASNHSPSFSNRSVLRKRTTDPLSRVEDQTNRTNTTYTEPESVTTTIVQKTTTVSLSWAAAEFDKTKLEDKQDKQNVQPKPATNPSEVTGVTPETLLTNLGEKPDHSKIQHHLYSAHKHAQPVQPKLLLQKETYYKGDHKERYNEEQDSAPIQLSRHELLLQQELQQQQQLIQDQMWRHSQPDWVNPQQDDQFPFFEEKHKKSLDPKPKVKTFLESNESIITKLKLVTTTVAVSTNFSTSNNTSSPLPSIISTSPSSSLPGKTVPNIETEKNGSSGPVSPSSVSVVAIYNSSSPSSEAPWVIVPPEPSSVDSVCSTCSCPRQGGIYLMDCSPQLRVKDDCGCCMVCLRGVHQTCGGIYQGLGKCAANLECIPLDGADYQSTRYDVQNLQGERHPSFKGTCQPKGKDDDPCQNVGCDTSIKYQCPKDSRLTTNASVSGGGSTSAESCCKHRLACLCNMNLCEIPKCGPGFTAQMIHKGTGKPGDCCNQFECKRNEKCGDVLCEEPKDCPLDSIKISQELTKDGCCFSDPVCICPSRDKCLPVECPLHFNIMVVEKATRKPGSCCDKFKCVSNKSESCYSDGVTYQHNSEWKLDNCTKCKCDNRLIYCEMQKCDSPQCSWMKTPEGECCPVCKGCMANGNLYKNNESWKEDDCVTCRCNEGIVECQTAMCSVPCPNPRRVPGQCCPVCENNCSFSCKYGYATDSQNREICECAKQVHKCPLLSSCKRRCAYGYKRTRHGCFRCKCNVCPPHECSKKCIYGYLTDARGCRICGCKGQPKTFVKTTPHINTDAEASMAPWRKTSCLSNGLYYKNAEMWNDGCRECYCKEGKELCSLIACSVPPCSNPLYRIGDCCPSCPGSEPISSKEIHTQEICHGENGNEYVEGETWELEKCTTCLCHHGIILCNTEMCPPQLCHFPVKVKGQCCAFCPRKADKPPRIPHKLLKHCLLDGKPAFKHGEVWRSNPCQSCTCRHGHIQCFSQTCPPLSCNQTVFRKGQCCPTCATKKPSTLSPSLTDNSIRKPTADNLIDTDLDDDTSYIIIIAILSIIICGVFGLLCLLLFNKYRNQA